MFQNTTRKGRKTVYRTVRAKIDALEYVGTYFFDDEDRIFWQWLPRFYYFGTETLWRLPAYASLFAFPFWIFPSQKIFLSFWLAYGAAFVLKAFIVRSICTNLLVVTQQAVYIYFRYHEERVDEIRWEDVETLTFRIWRFAPSLATVRIRKRGRAAHIRSYLRKRQIFRNRYQQTETLDYRDLSLVHPFKLRLVVRNHGELYERCKQLKQTEGYTFLLKRKGKTYAQRRTDRDRAAK